MRARLICRLRWLMVASPHSYERASYLDSLLLVDRQGTLERLPPHLLDCEERVRLLAARHVPLTDATRSRLVALRDDPIEAEEVRRVAAGRVGTT